LKYSLEVLGILTTESGGGNKGYTRMMEGQMMLTMDRKIFLIKSEFVMNWVYELEEPMDREWSEQ
jgi:hypothetical protein